MKRLIILIMGVLFLLSCEMASVKVTKESTLAPSVSQSVNAATIGHGVELSKSIDLGVAGDYNLFVLGDMEMMWTDALGRVAASGDITISGYGIALEETELTDEYALVAGGSISHTYGSVYYGNVAYGETYNATGVSILNGEAFKDTPIDFASAEAELKTLSAYLESLEADGDVVNKYGAIIFTGSNEEVNIFSITTEEMESAHTLDINIPEGSTAVINVEGTDTAVMNKGMTTAFDAQKQNVLFNFPNQTELTIQSIGLKGSVLAPYAALTFQWGNIEGNIVAASVYGSGESHLYPFIPVEVEEEEPEVPEDFVITCVQVLVNGYKQVNKIIIYGNSLSSVTSVTIDGEGSYSDFVTQVDTVLSFYTESLLESGSYDVAVEFDNGAETTVSEAIIIE